ncbi:glycosyltransferase WbuB [Butyrivibrio sp. X503]|uniref:glycosyltransferase family 4 protein n=1 Tax=Butyrivibrio sp. X503 TaxID=2364878 RepID=UPI000EA8A19D|nr:glycosyltransferase family 4 protein [Butyrivibrio sp. X503]RKM54463.1 glycosyltransferase WbuB [Butyrivibrio sp. X503]
MSKKILVICQYFYPEQFRINDICTEWVRRGYDVTVLTGIPNYPQGKFYKGYGFFKKTREIWNGIKIIRIPLIPRGHTPIGLVLNYFSFPISGFFWNIFAKIQADYVFMFETSPMTQCKIGVRYAKKHKVPLYLYVQDLWPENVEIVTGIHNPLIIKPIDKMVDKIYKACDEIFVTSPSFVEAVVNRKVPVQRDKVHYWPQYAEDFYKPVTMDEARSALAGNADKGTKELIQDTASFKIAFTGNIGYAQGLDVLPATAKLLKDTDIKFVIIGDGRYKSKLISEINELEVSDKFILIDRQPAEIIPDYLGLCDAAFISFMDTQLFTWTIPAKLQSYMACGMPIIASAKGETERVIKEADCGVCVDIGNADQLAKVIKELNASFKAEYGYKSRLYFESNFSKKELLDKFEQFFHRKNQ